MEIFKKLSSLKKIPYTVPIVILCSLLLLIIFHQRPQTKAVKYDYTRNTSTLASKVRFTLPLFITLTPPMPTNPPVENVKNSEDAKRIPILYYHYIEVNPDPKDTLRSSLAVVPSVFDGQMNYLSTNGFTGMTLDDMAAVFDGKATLPPKPIILTFDDGYADFYANAYPILSKYHLKATLFIITRLVGRRNYLTWDQIKDMQKSGLIFFGAHTQTHPSLPRLFGKRLEDEILGSKKDLESELGIPVNWFAYPYGGFSDAVVTEVEKAGFVGALTTLQGGWHTRNNFYLLRRIRVGGLSPVSFANYINSGR